jgi:hypothetical protein
MVVFAFDRDWTVDVNPHPHHEAVPLEWVRHLAHETAHAVYAIGNQDLATEAAIPGVVDIVGRHSDDWDDWLGAKQPDGYYERFPLRRERLALIEDLHPEADRYVVVDDLDLRDVEGWDHFHAWEFVPAVEAGRIDSTLPWTTDSDGGNEPVTDGGLAKPAGIIPADASDLTSFLDEYGDTPGFEITDTAEGEEVTRLCWDITVVADPSGESVEDPTVRCSPLTPDREAWTVPVDAIEMLHVVKLPVETVTARAETPTEEAAALRRFADATPHRVPVSPILTLLDREDTTTRQQRDAVRALASVAAVKPEECTPAVPIVRSLLQDSDLAVPHDALATLRAIGQDSPGDIAPATEDITPSLDSDRVPARREAAGCVAAIAREYPGDVVDAVPGLVACLGEDTARQRHAVTALEQIAAEFPDAVEPAAEQLADIVTDASVTDRVRLSATAALGRTVKASPSLGVDVFEDVVALFDADNYKLRNNAVALAYDMAELHTDLVEPSVDDIAALLTVEDARTRVNATGTLARVADDFPESVAHLTPTFVELLSDDDHRVRDNACWALGYLQASAAQAALEEQLQDESNESVRNSIAWALSEIETV